MRLEVSTKRAKLAVGLAKDDGKRKASSGYEAFGKFGLGHGLFSVEVIRTGKSRNEFGALNVKGLQVMRVFDSEDGVGTLGSWGCNRQDANVVDDTNVVAGVNVGVRNLFGVGVHN